MTVVLAVVPGMFNAAAIVIDERGTILGHAESPSPGSRHDPRDPEMLWRSVGDAGCRAVSEAGRPTLDAVGVSSRGPGSTTADERLWTAMIAPMFAVLVVA